MFSSALVKRLIFALEQLEDARHFVSDGGDASENLVEAMSAARHHLRISVMRAATLPERKPEAADAQ